MTKVKYGRKKIPKMIINPEWIKSNPDFYKKQKRTNIRLMKKNTLGFRAYEPSEYYPEEYGIDFSKMQWICIKHPPNTIIKVPKFSIWLAKPDERPHLSFKDISWKLWEILTPEGTLGIRFHECFIVDLDDYVEWLNTKHCVMKTFGSFGGVSSKLSAQMFYLQSRGIGKMEAMKLILKNLDSRDVCYFVFNKEYQRYYMAAKDGPFILDDVVRVGAFEGIN